MNLHAYQSRLVYTGKLTEFRVDIDQVYHRVNHDDDAVGSLDECAARCNSGNGVLLAKQPASLNNQANDPQHLYLNLTN